MIYFSVSVGLLASLLFFPISKLIWVLSVRRLQRKLQQPLEGEQIKGQLARARFIAVFVSLIFSLLFNMQILGSPFHG